MNKDQEFISSFNYREEKTLVSLFFKKQFLFIYLFLAMLGLHCYTGFSLVGVRGGCGVQTSHCGGFSCFRAQALGWVGFSSFTTWAQ